MSKLWIFGDSYGVHLNQQPGVVGNPWFWGYQLAKKLECKKYSNISQLGVANEYIQNSIMLEKNNIRSGDYVVIISTSMSRKWFFEDIPHSANFYVDNYKDIVGWKRNQAVIKYAQQLMHEEQLISQFHQFLGWVHYMTDLHDWNVIVIPGFEEEGYPISHKYQVTGSLFNICMNEFESRTESEWFYQKFCQGRDNRLGHLIKDNHEILSTKLYNTFTFKTQLNLHEGFIEKVISKKNINQMEDQFIFIDTKEKTLFGYPTMDIDVL